MVQAVLFFLQLEPENGTDVDALEAEMEARANERRDDYSVAIAITTN